ncbi:FAD-dependent oxidoreductase [Acuticoccus kandeliae]|uniref:FAD-dependent oxidoreductase n=1 Tax=Acuticoccus kandeliae TaxID=2073160 RepID=UPI000D3E2AEA|nr:FAD-dependent oxidoreductase [Acuticoccus kandeliae]
MNAPLRPRIVIAGAGHAALVALEALAREPAEAELVLVSRGPEAHYSGMVPGWVEGIYPRAAMSIPLAPVCARAGARLVVGDIVGADAAALHLADGRALPFDILVINAGAETARVGALAGPSVIPAKPFEALIAGVERTREDGGDIVVAGGGVGGVEFALSLAAGRPGRRVRLVERGPCLVPGHPAAFARRLGRALEARGIAVALGEDVAPDAAETVFAFTGAHPPSFLAATPFAKAPGGFLAVDTRMRSLSHRNVLAVGDTATCLADPRPKSGVFSVRAGRPLAAAIRALAQGEEPPVLRLQRRGLILAATGGRRAVGVRNGIVLEGALVWRLKDRLDRGFVARFKGN